MAVGLCHGESFKRIRFSFSVQPASANRYVSIFTDIEPPRICSNEQINNGGKAERQEKILNKCVALVCAYFIYAYISNAQNSETRRTTHINVT